MACIVAELAAEQLPMPIIGLVFKEAAAAGLDFETLVRRCELPYSAEALARGQLSAMPRAHVTYLYRASMAMLAERLLKTEGRSTLRFEETELMCSVIIHSNYLSEAIAGIERFNAMLESRQIQVSLTVEDGMAVFSMETFRTRKTHLTFLLDLMGLSFYYQLFGWLIGERISVSDVSLAYEELVPHVLVAPLFDRSVRFDQRVNSLRFPADVLQRPVLRNHDDLLKLQQYFPFEILPGYLAANRLSERVFGIFKGSLIKHCTFPQLSRVATLLSQGGCALRRKLLAEGTSISQIKGRCRREVAMDLLSYSGLSVDEISDRLGFSAPSAFRRAFKSWVGQSVSEYMSAAHRPATSKLELLRLKQ